MNDIFPLAVSIAEAVRLSSVCRTSLYAAIKRNELAVRKSGRRTIVEVAALKAWLAGLPKGGNRDAA